MAVARVERISRKAFAAASLGALIAPCLTARAMLSGASNHFYVFWRPGGAILAGKLYIAGHVGFAYQRQSGDFLAGSIENAHGKFTPEGKDFWTYATADPVTISQLDHIRAPVPWSTRYDFYKILQAEKPDAAAAKDAVDTVTSWRYIAGRQDCLSAVRLVMTAYGIPLKGRSAKTLLPNDFFKALPGKMSAINGPAWRGSALDVSLYSQYRRDGERDDIIHFGRHAVVWDNLYPDHENSRNIPTWRSSSLVRRGHLALYSEHNCKGEVVYLRPDDFANFNSLPWSDPRVRSFCASAGEFKPQAPPIAEVPPRFASESALRKYDQSLERRP